MNSRTWKPSTVSLMMLGAMATATGPSAKAALSLKYPGPDDRLCLVRRRIGAATPERLRFDLPAGDHGF
jgi:hypothetical protein